VDLTYGVVTYPCNGTLPSDTAPVTATGTGTGTGDAGTGTGPVSAPTVPITLAPSRAPTSAPVSADQPFKILEDDLLVIPTNDRF
jgi:hypothetical protein